MEGLLARVAPVVGGGGWEGGQRGWWEKEEGFRVCCRPEKLAALDCAPFLLLAASHPTKHTTTVPVNKHTPEDGCVGCSRNEQGDEQHTLGVRRHLLQHAVAGLPLLKQSCLL